MEVGGETRQDTEFIFCRLHYFIYLVFQYVIKNRRKTNRGF